MKVPCLVLALLGSLAIAQSAVEDDCQCPQIKCRATNAFESCRCSNAAELACKKKCPNYVSKKWRVCSLPQQELTSPVSGPTAPTSTPSTSTEVLPLPTDPVIGLPLPIPPVPFPSPLVLPLPDLPLVPGCECEETMCIMSFPEGCHCQWNVKKDCYDKCGGVSPGINTCSALPVPPVPKPSPRPKPSPPVLSLPDLPEVPGCECEQMMCIQSYPDSCHCEWGIAKNCYDKCGGKSPGPNTCPPKSLFGGGLLDDSPVKRDAAPEPQRSTVPIPVDIPKAVAGVVGALENKACDFEERFCIQQWPQSCICANANKYLRYLKCGGAIPTYQSCTSPSKPNLPTTIKTVTRTTTTTKLPTPTPKPELHKVQICGGGRGSQLQDCPTGYTCVNDPYANQLCGLECDRTGICVEEKLCGGFAGFKCSAPGQVCLDDPRDGCSPKTGGADCGGLCFWPPALRAKA
ncbi:hypothetical protein E8E12_009295 [Didymella heteroderae]|uniref:Uncharacterized protein n=1 Tax=Didymella heteroderae TaxID=1769908 RepID=A0A9P4WYF4_9PLEO|nr:hypothetical protein E8E12_009295 [Didymella heteroderae]